MTYCQTCKRDLGESDSDTTNAHVQAGHIVLAQKPKPLKFDIAHTVNHFLIEPIIWAISAYGIFLGLIVSVTSGFFTLKEYSITGLGLILSPTQIQTYDLWYDAYPYSLMIFGSYLLALYLKFRKDKKGFLALPVFILTYATWDFLGIGVHIADGFSIVWLGISVIGLIYYFPIRKQFEVNISFIGLVLFFGIGILYLPSIFLTRVPFTHIIIGGNEINSYMQGISNELTFSILCLLSIKLKTK